MRVRERKEEGDRLSCNRQTDRSRQEIGTDTTVRYLSNLTYLLPSKKGKDKDLREVRKFQVVEDLMR